MNPALAGYSRAVWAGAAQPTAGAELTLHMSLAGEVIACCRTRALGILNRW